MDLLYAHFTQLYAALRKAKTLYATLRTWQLADVSPPLQMLYEHPVGWSQEATPGQTPIEGGSSQEVHSQCPPRPELAQGPEECEV